MKVAFDVVGTLEGGGPKVRALLDVLKARGHEIFIWSSFYSFAYKWANKLGTEAFKKYSRMEAEDLGSTIFDVAVDDDSMQWWLAADEMVLVHKIPEEETALVNYVIALERAANERNARGFHV